MIVTEGPRYLAFPVWARGGQAPLRAQASLLSGASCLIAAGCSRLARRLFGRESRREPGRVSARRGRQRTGRANAG